MTEKPRALLFGAQGQVGRAIAQPLAARWDVTAVTRREVDLAEPRAIERVIAAVNPRLVINAAAYTAVDAAESNAELSMRINRDAPASMARAADEIGATLVHFSTDYVFDGTKRLPYIETDPTAPLGVYGKTKLAGDLAIAESRAPHLIFRTSWVYAPTGKNFFVAIVKRATETGQLRVVDDQTGAPTSANSIASGVIQVLERLALHEKSRAVSEYSGVYNLTASGSTTWFDFARAILHETGIQASLDPTTTEAFGAPAPRPRYSVLSNEKLERVFGVTLPSWERQLSDVVAEWRASAQS